jgi:hypothetical protein
MSVIPVQMKNMSPIQSTSAVSVKFMKYWGTIYGAGTHNTVSRRFYTTVDMFLLSVAT